MGIISNLTQPKTPNLTRIFEVTLSSKTNTLLIKNKLNVNKTIKTILSMNKIDLIFVKNDLKNIKDEKYNPFVFRIVSFIGHSKLFSKITSLYKTCYILPDITKFKESLALPLPKGHSLITSFGEVFHPDHSVFFYGSFCLAFNFIFDKIHLHNYILRWIRLFSIWKKKNSLKILNNNFFYLKIKIPTKKKPFWFKGKKNFIEEISNNESNCQNYFLYKIKKIIITQERTGFFCKIKNLKPKQYDFNKNIIRNYKKIVLNFQAFIYKKMKHYVKTYNKKENHVFFMFWINVLKFSILFFAIQKVIKISPIIYNFNTGTKFNSSNNPFHLPFCCLKKFKKSMETARLLSQFFSIFKKKLYYFSFINQIHFSYLSNESEEMSGKFEKFLDITYFKQIQLKYNIFLLKRIKVEKDRLSIEEIIARLNFKKKEILILAFQRINNSLMTIFKALVPICTATIVIIKNKNEEWVGLKFKVFVNSIQKKPAELSGGQKSILALSFIFSLLLFRPAPFYILDEVDAALDFCYTKNISCLVFQSFSFAQFIIVSLKKQIILDAEVVFEVKQNLGNSRIMRLEKISKTY